VQRALEASTIVLALALAAAWIAHAVAGDDHVVWVVLHGLVPWWSSLALLGGALAVWARRPAWVWAHVGLLTLYAWAQTRAGAVDGSARRDLRLATANVYIDNPDVDTLVEELADADVVVLVECTAPCRDAVRRRSASWPYVADLGREDEFGLIIASRFPLRDVTELRTAAGVEWLKVTLELPSGPVPLLGLHTLPPYRADWMPIWHAHLERAAEAGAGAIVAGDLNITPWHPSFAVFRAAGLRDAAGPTDFTWPNLAGLPSLMALDHVLVGPGLGVSAVQRRVGRGSDHRPLVVDLQVSPVAPSAW
jgi:endonuclease/exonuclease/phosphatase (EEP) superfamily protein YafD